MRALEKLAIEPSGRPPGKPVKLDWLPLAKLVVDDSYQRDTGQQGRALVRRIAAHFQWRKFSPVIVVAVSGGRYAIIDGQHRSTAALSLGYDNVPCAIVHATPAEAAEIFAAVNGNVIRMSTFSLFKAGLAAGVQWATDVEQACAAAGVRPLTYPVPVQKQKPGETNAIGRLRRIAERHGRDALTATLRIVMAHPLAHVPAYVNSARVDQAYQDLQGDAAWRADPLAAAGRVIKSHEMQRPVAAPLPALPPPAQNKSLVTVTDDAAARLRVQELKARGFSKSMVAAVTKYRHSAIEKLWESPPG